MNMDEYIETIKDCDYWRPVSVITLTPEIASEFLNHIEYDEDKKRPEHQRKLRNYYLNMSNDIKNDRWDWETAAFIDFDTKGRLINGQHRCHAVIKAGKPIRALVRTNMPDKSYESYDRGIKRSAADTVGGKNATKKMAITRTLIALTETTKLSVMKCDMHISDNQKFDVYMANSEIIDDMTSQFMRLRKATIGGKGLTIPTYVWCLSYFALISDEQTAFLFFDEMCKPIGTREPIFTMFIDAIFRCTTAERVKMNDMVAKYAISTFSNWIKGIVPLKLVASKYDVDTLPIKQDWLVM